MKSAATNVEATVGNRAVALPTPNASNATAVSQYCSGGFSKYLSPFRRGVSQSPLVAISRAISA